MIKEKIASESNEFSALSCPKSSIAQKEEEIYMETLAKNVTFNPRPASSLFDSTFSVA